MKRREFITVLGCAAAAWPVAARAQRTPIPVIGWLSMRSASDSDFAVAAFLRGVEETGHIHGQNVTIEYRWLENNHERLPSAVAQPTKFELVINQKAAKALSLDMPLSILARADEVIE